MSAPPVATFFLLASLDAVLGCGIWLKALIAKADVFGAAAILAAWLWRGVPSSCVAASPPVLVLHLGYAES